MYYIKMHSFFYIALSSTLNFDMFLLSGESDNDRVGTDALSAFLVCTTYTYMELHTR